MLDPKLKTKAAVNRVEGELDVALLKPLMGMVESWALHEASVEAKAAFVDGFQALWAEAKRTGKPALKREELPGAELLLKHRLAIEDEAGVQIPCVSEWWSSVQNYRHAGSRGGRPKKGSERVPKGLVSEPFSTPENTEVSRETNGTPIATRARPDSGKEEGNKKGREKKTGREVGVIAAKRDNSSGTPDIGFAFLNYENQNLPTFSPKFPGFDAFWRVYPVHREKPVALEWWKKLHCEDIADQIVARVELLKATDDPWSRGFVKHPHRWLRDHGWEDEPIPAPKPKPTRAEEYAAKMKRWVETGVTEPMDDTGEVIDITPKGGMH